MAQIQREPFDRLSARVLGGGGDVAFNGEVDEEGPNFVCAHFGGALFVVEEHVAADPIEVGFFGAIGVMFGAQGIGDTFDTFGQCKLGRVVFLPLELTFWAQIV